MLFAILPDGSCLFVQPAELLMRFASPARLQVSGRIIGVENGDAVLVGAEQLSFFYTGQQGNNDRAETKELER